MQDTGRRTEVGKKKRSRLRKQAAAAANRARDKAEQEIQRDEKESVSSGRAKKQSFRFEFLHQNTANPQSS